MKKILIIGGKSKLALCFQKMYDKECIGLDKSRCDITSEKSLKKEISRFSGKYILNCAAMTDMIKCEQDPIECFKINTSGVFLLNRVCLELKKKLVHISSNYAINPLNVYGWSKMLSEKIMADNFLAIRTDFYNQDAYIIRNLLQGKKINAYSNLYINPVSIISLVKKIHASLGKKGVLNIFSDKRISYYQFALLFCEIFGIDAKLVKPLKYTDSDIFKRPTDSYIESDIEIDIKQDLILFKKFYENQ